MNAHEFLESKGVKSIKDNFNAYQIEQWLNEYASQPSLRWGAITEIDKARFWSKAKEANGYCWEWQANKDSDGYGMFRVQGVYTKASRVAYQIINGEIAEGIHVLHKCDNPACINPDHLFTGTHQDNMNDKMRKGRGRHLGRRSKYYGVGWREDSKNWRAYIVYSENGKRKNLSFGGFATEIEAAKKRDEEVKKLNLDLPLNF